jgi:transposase
VDTITDSKKITRRRHAPDLKAKILRECDQPGASVASVAMSHGINANVVHKWRRQANAGVAPLADAAFIPIALPAPVATASQEIRVELRRGATAMTITWPVASAAECAVWMRELLR